MRMIVAIVKPNKAEAVKAAVIKLGVLGMTATECKGFGKQLGHSERYRGPKTEAGWVPKVMILTCVKETEKDAAMKAIVEAARSGEVGDGKVFLLPVDEAVRIRSGERDDAAL